MNLLEKLSIVSASKDSLTSFLEDNYQSVYDFFLTQSYSDLNVYRSETELYIQNNIRIIGSLDLSKICNLDYLTILLDVCERLNFRAFFRRLFILVSRYVPVISGRIEASGMYLNNIRSFDDYNEILDRFLTKLQYASENEDDNSDKAIAVFVNYYAILVRDFGAYNQEEVRRFSDKLRGKIVDYNFIQNDLVSNILSIDTSNPNLAFKLIQETIDAYLQRKLVRVVFTSGESLIESDTNYCYALKNVDKDLQSIRQVSLKLCSNSNDTFYSLGRGVNILTDEDQLFSYMKSFGNMHFSKLNDAFEYLPNIIFRKPVEIIDWGCGQALAAMAYLNYLKENDIEQKISRITLNEPSEIAIKRGALHIEKFNNDVELLTINKDLDSLAVNDFIGFENIRLHMFSNILDIDHFSMPNLISLIKDRFIGINYFIIVSPYISNLKTSRINSFIDGFRDLNNFEMFKSIDNQKGEWKKDWSMVLRVFKVAL